MTVQEHKRNDTMEQELQPTKKSLNELREAFNDVSQYAPYLVGEVTIKVKLFINHPEASDNEEDGVTQDCILSIEAPPPSILPPDTDPTFIADVQRNSYTLCASC
jgi:hypothetical protein